MKDASDSDSRLASQAEPLPPAELVIIGAAAVDIIAKVASSSSSSSSTNSASALINHSTVPGTVQTSLGGVARNMAEAAHRSLTSLSLSDSGSEISTETLLVAPIGDDAFGALIRRQTEDMGMRSDGYLSGTGTRESESGPGAKSSNLTQDTERSTPVCNMLLSADGNLLGGVADFSALDTLRSDEVRSKFQYSGNKTRWTHTYCILPYHRSFRFLRSILLNLLRWTVTFHRPF